MGNGVSTERRRTVPLELAQLQLEMKHRRVSTVVCSKSSNAGRLKKGTRSQSLDGGIGSCSAGSSASSTTTRGRGSAKVNPIVEETENVTKTTLDDGGDVDRMAMNKASDQRAFTCRLPTATHGRTDDDTGRLPIQDTILLEEVA